MVGALELSASSGSGRLRLNIDRLSRRVRWPMKIVISSLLGISL